VWRCVEAFTQWVLWPRHGTFHGLSVCNDSSSHLCDGDVCSLERYRKGTVAVGYCPGQTGVGKASGPARGESAYSGRNRMS